MVKDSRIAIKYVYKFLKQKNFIFIQHCRENKLVALKWRLKLEMEVLTRFNVQQGELMSYQNCILSDQDVVLVGHMTFPVKKKIICRPVISDFTSSYWPS